MRGYFACMMQGVMARLKLPLPHRDSLGWLIPVLLFCIFYGAFLVMNNDGFLQELGILFFLVGGVGLAFSRRVRRLITYHILPKTPERRETFAYETMMDAAKRLARKEKVAELVTGLYFNYLVHVPGWMSADDAGDEVVIPPVISAARKMPGNRIAITLSGKEYIFTYVQYVYSTTEGERDTQATLQVALANQKLFLVHLVPQGGTFRPVSIEYVVMTDWVNEFRHLQELITEEQEKRRHEDRMN